MKKSIITELLEKERLSLNYFFDKIDIDVVDQILQKLLHCSGAIVLTGIGKSGLIAKKIAVTMTSTGTKALFLSPTNALHGDMGILDKKDIFIVLSKSGESDELMSLIPFVRNRGVPIIAFVNNEKSRLAKAADLFLLISSGKELCPFDMAPTTSTTIQSIVGDILAIALMRLKNVSVEDFIRSHPAGRLGRRATVLVKDLMLKGEDIPLAQATDTLVDSLVKLSDKRCGCLLIVDDKKRMLGIFTDGDLRRALQEKGGELLSSTLAEQMMKNPRFIEESALAYTALKKMESNQKRPIMVLPVLDEDQKVVGLLKMHDLIQSGI